MTFLHHSVPSSFDKNASSLQHTDAFSIGSEHCSEEHRSHKRPKDVFDCDRHFLNLKSNLPPLFLLVMMHSLVVLH